MAEKKKTKKLRTGILLPIAVYTFLVSCLLYFCSCLFLRSYNNTLSTKKQSVESQVLTVKQENDEAEKEVNQLASQNRVAAVAQSSLSYQAQNIVTVTNGE
jgi:cell division protein FtsL